MTKKNSPVSRLGEKPQPYQDRKSVMVIVVINPRTRLVMVQTAVRKNFIESRSEDFALWRGVLRAFGQN